MRAFIALSLPPTFADDAELLSRALERQLEGRFVPYENRHVTLAFLGEIGESEAASAIDALESACLHAPRPTLSPQGLGVFGRGKEGALYLALAPEERLMSLAGRLREELSARGIAFDGKPLLPHITIARRARLGAQDLGDLPFPREAKAEEATLYRSILSPEGPTYKPLHVVSLAQ